MLDSVMLNQICYVLHKNLLKNTLSMLLSIWKFLCILKCNLANMTTENLLVTDKAN